MLGIGQPAMRPAAYSVFIADDGRRGEAIAPAVNSHDPDLKSGEGRRRSGLVFQQAPGSNCAMARRLGSRWPRE